MLQDAKKIVSKNRLITFQQISFNFIFVEFSEFLGRSKELILLKRQIFTHGPNIRQKDSRSNIYSGYLCKFTEFLQLSRQRVLSNPVFCFHSHDVFKKPYFIEIRSPNHKNQRNDLKLDTGIIIYKRCAGFGGDTVNRREGMTKCVVVVFLCQPCRRIIEEG